jgi:uncharacterized protein (TIGR03437 family)
MVNRKLWLCFAAATAFAQPGIRQNGVVNAASQIPSTLPGGAIARGSLFTIFGVRFGAQTTVTISRNGAPLAVRILSSRPEQIDAEMPENAPVGPASLMVTSGGLESKAVDVNIVASNPGIFSRNGLGWGPGRIQNINANGGRSENSTLHSAQPRQRISLRVTGLGPSKMITVMIGDRPVKGEIRSPVDGSGESEVLATLPADTPEGCYVPVYLQAGPARASNVVTVSVQSSGGPCDPGPVPMIDAGKIGIAVMSRRTMRVHRENKDTVTDEAAVAFAVHDNEPLSSPLPLLPPPGTCTAYTGSFQAETPMLNSVSAALISNIAGHGLDAGRGLTVSREGAVRTIPQERGAPGYYRTRLGSAGVSVNRRATPLILDPGEYTLAGMGGTGVGPFHAVFSMGAPFEWINREESGVVDQRRPLSVSWNDASADRWIIILATNVDQVTTANGTCLCVAHSNAGHFVIPASLLANLPASVETDTPLYGRLYLAAMSARTPSPIQAPGLSRSAVISLQIIGRFVEYR